MKISKSSDFNIIITVNIIQKQDIGDFVNHFKLRDEVRGRSFLITGVTGLIGSTLVHCLLAVDKRIKIIAPVRNINKAVCALGEDATLVDLIACDIVSFDYETIGNVDYIIHCAAPTASKYFIEKPVETFNIIVDGTRVLLEYATRHKTKGFVYLSSLEVYGEIHDDSIPVDENVQGYLDPISVRSSYPMAKRAVENLCVLYASEYHVPVKIARLTQTTGAGIAKDDNRVIAQFARLAANGQDIILHTEGESARPYCYITDCIEAILFILLKGDKGEAYNVANEDTYISVKDMADFVRQKICPSINIRMELDNPQEYAPPTKLRLSTEKLRGLGWKPRHDLMTIFIKLIDYLTL